MKKTTPILFLTLLTFTSYAQFQNVKVDSNSQYGECSVIINHKNTSQILSGSNLNKVNHSHNGGVTWSNYNLAMDGDNGDPCGAVDTSGNFYFAHLGGTLTKSILYRSTNAGVTWNLRSNFGTTTIRDVDKEWILFDIVPTSPYKNTLYGVWAEFDDYSSSSPLDSSEIKLSKSTNEGQTWSTPVIVSKQRGNCGFNAIKGAVPAIGPNGELYVTWCGNGVSFQKSTDGGATWLMNDIIIDTQVPTWYFTIPGFTWGTGFPGIACDVSGGPNNGNIYVVWCDQRNGTSNTDVFMAKSTNGGMSWTTQRINNDQTVSHQSHPWVAVDQTTGYIYINFYDRRNMPNSTNMTDVYMAYSIDGGNSFTNVKINSSTSQIGIWCDYIGIAAHNGIIRPIWSEYKSISNIGTRMALISHSQLVGLKDELTDSPLTLFQNYPNPLQNITIIDFQLQQEEKISITITDLLGKVVAIPIKDVSYSQGMHQLVLNTQELNLVNGIYYYTLNTAKSSDTKKMLIQQ